MSDEADEVLLPIAEAARRLRVAKITVTRAMDEGTFASVRFRRTRRANGAQVAYVLDAIRSGRSGSVEEFAAEWLAKRQPAEAVAS